MATLGTYRCLLCLLCFLDRNCFCTHSQTHTVAVWPCWLRIWVMSCLHESSLYRVHTGKVKVALVSCLLFLSLCWQLCVDTHVDSVGNLKILCFCFWTAKHVKKPKSCGPVSCVYFPPHLDISPTQHGNVVWAVVVHPSTAVAEQSLWLSIMLSGIYSVWDSICQRPEQTRWRGLWLAQQPWHWSIWSF